MPDKLPAAIAFCAGRYDETQRTAWLAIINQARELKLRALNPERDLLDWLSKPHASTDLARACELMLERLGE